MSQRARPVRVHHVINTGRTLCEYEAPRPHLGETEIAELHYCGACLAVLMWLSVHHENLWEGICKPPDLSPNESLVLLRKTRWATLMDTNVVAGNRNTWWYESKEPVA